MRQPVYAGTSSEMLVLSESDNVAHVQSVLCSLFSKVCFSIELRAASWRSMRAGSNEDMRMECIDWAYSNYCGNSVTLYIWKRQNVL